MHDLNYKSQRTSERGQWTKVASNIHYFMTTILSTADYSYVAPHSGRLCVLQWSCLNVNAMCVHTLLFVFSVALGKNHQISNLYFPPAVWPYRPSLSKGLWSPRQCAGHQMESFP